MRLVLEQDINIYERRERAVARVWELAGGYAPTVGILGAVLGLIQVMENLGDPSRLGAGIAVAFVATVYGDDDSAKSTDEAKGLLKSYPNLKAIIAPTTVGVVAAAQVVTDMGLIGKVNVVGLALPSEFKQFILNGSSTAAALWNPIDLGYSAVQISYQLVKGTAKAEPGATISIGRVGSITLNDTLSADMAPPFEFNKGNIEEFSKIY